MRTSRLWKSSTSMNMARKILVSFFGLFCVLFGKTNTEQYKFPDDFKFGVATASYQVEGAWNEDGKGESIWDRLTHTHPEIIDEKDNGDVACDSYHLWKQDVELLKNLKVDFYRFSISWPRILPTGFTNKINQAGVDYYRNLIEALIDNGIEPMVTLYHWDLPQPLQDIGGWPNEELVEHFANYARVAFEQFGDLVKTWVTFNEPKNFCQGGYGAGWQAPAISLPAIAEYICTHNVIKAHAKAWHIYDEEFRATQKGRISIVLDTEWYEPANQTDPRDEQAAERMRQFLFGWYAHPIFHGNYPQIMIDRVDERSAKEGFPRSRLPKFTDEEIEYIRGTHDFLGLNHYTSKYTKFLSGEPGMGEPNFWSDLNVDSFFDESWDTSASSWLRPVPWGLRKLLKWVKDSYNDTEVIITENGVSDKGALQDDSRIKFYQDYLTSVVEAIHEDEVKVTAYTAWSLMDNFEWYRGYTEKFGLIYVDFDSPERTRTEKASAKYYRRVIETRLAREEEANDDNGN